MDKVVLITGASSGMGKETAQLLHQNGYVVYAAARRLDKMKDLQTIGINTIYMDVADDDSMSKAVQLIFNAVGKIDILVNNAGFGSYGAIEDVSMPDARYQMEVNLFGAARLIQLVLPRMRENRFGKIVNISSIGGKFATPFGGWYHASKFALEGMSDALRNEVKPLGIDVIIIEPGGVKSEWGDIAFTNLFKNSASSAYKSQIDILVKAMKKAQAANKNAEPALIAGIIKKSIEEKSPKIRYVAGYMAKPATIARKLLSDKLFDRMIMNQMK